MTVPIGEVVEPLAVQNIDLKESIGSRAFEAQLDSMIDVSLNGVLDKALTLPGANGFGTHSPNDFLGSAGSNSFVSSNPSDETAPKSYEDIMERISNLYAETAAFKVAWDVAKRSGRSVETLLKGQ